MVSRDWTSVRSDTGQKTPNSPQRPPRFAPESACSQMVKPHALGDGRITQQRMGAAKQLLIGVQRHLGDDARRRRV
jgi:hypothetical protein